MSQFIKFLPFTCANPVSPGRTSCLCLSSSVYQSKYDGKSGLGPTILISPLIILNASGNSSKLVDLSNFPNFVSRLLSGNKLPSLSLLSVIVLNLYSLNNLSFFPGLYWVNRIGDPNFTLTKIATIKYNHEKHTTAPKAQIKSNGLFTYFSYTPYGLCFFTCITASFTQNSSLLLQLSYPVHPLSSLYRLEGKALCCICPCRYPLFPLICRHLFLLCRFPLLL